MIARALRRDQAGRRTERAVRPAAIGVFAFVVRLAARRRTRAAFRPLRLDRMGSGPLRAPAETSPDALGGLAAGEGAGRRFRVRIAPFQRAGAGFPSGDGGTWGGGKVAKGKRFLQADAAGDGNAQQARIAGQVGEWGISASVLPFPVAPVQQEGVQAL